MPSANSIPAPTPLHSKPTRRTHLATLIALLIPLWLCAATHASNPRWVTGPSYFTGPSGNAVTWFTTSPLYFTDPGDLSPSVNHASADALVAAAAGVWNVPTSAMVLAKGGSLAEHIGAANAYLSDTGPVFPADVQSANYAAIQIAVLFDSDGSITDMLLGSGASSPAECRQNAVTESVDAITPAGSIQHAILVLNGRCTGPAPAQQLQMQYQLQRAFGRVLGIGWSQTNDNVFTRNPQPTTIQALNWPIMHPIDIVCGDYTYQCLSQPFTLRDDDIAAITTLYPMMTYCYFPSTPPAPGKVWSFQEASAVSGTVAFPTGQGMQGVNVLIQRREGGAADAQAWADISSVTGFLFQQNAGNPVTGLAPGLAESLGATDPTLEGFYNLGWVPNIDPANSPIPRMTGLISTEPINPLYIGAYSVGPYAAGAVSPSGAPESQFTNNVLNLNDYPWSPVVTNFAPPDAASTCDPTADGIETAPNAVPATGWWTAVLCAHGHSAWSTFSARAGRTATLEVTALDTGSLGTIAKLMPLLGVWAATDPTGTLPTIAATPSAFNTVNLGMTATNVATSRPQVLRFVIADQRGDGRPDFAYQARVLYADTIQPAIVSLNGGLIVISGTGFRPGNEVTVNGIPAAVSSWSATAIVAVPPPQTAFASKLSGPVDVAVVDLSTGGRTRMTAALTYANIAPDTMTLVSAPTGTVAVGTPATTPFAVRVLLSDGVTPVVGLPVTFTANPANVEFAACPTSPCIVLTDATGLASTALTPTAFGPVTVQASAVGVTQSAAFTAVARGIALVQSQLFIAANATVSWTPQAALIQNGAPASGTSVNWSVSTGIAISPASTLASASGIAQTTAIVGPLASGAQATGEACAWTTLCAAFTTIAVDPSALRLAIVSGAGQSVSAPSSTPFTPVIVMVTDGSGHPVAGVPVAIDQTVDAAQMPCPAHGPCPIAPTLAESKTTAVSDPNGLVSVTPMQLACTPEVTNIAVAAGTQGFVSLSLNQQP